MMSSALRLFHSDPAVERRNVPACAGQAPQSNSGTRGPTRRQRCLTAATEAQVRAHESGTRRLPEGSYSLHDARGRHQCRLDIGERVCKRAVVEVLAQRPEHDSAKENRPTGFWSKKGTC